MNKQKSISEHISAYENHLRLEEKSTATIEKYLRDIRAFACWLDRREITKERTAEWKTHLVERGYAPASINAMLSALNGLLDFLDLGTCQVKFLKLQRRMFRDDSRDLTRADYERLVATAQERGQNRLALLMEAICATGIRVSEVRYITVEAAKAGRAEIALKGKIRTISDPQQTLPKAAEIRQEQQNRFRRGLSHQKRDPPQPSTDLGGDERTVQGGGGHGEQGLSPQLPPSVRHGLLPGQPGHCEAGRCAGSQQY